MEKVAYSLEPRIVRFSLPAEPSAASVACKFIREIARSTCLTAEEVADLQLRVVEAFNKALCGQVLDGTGRVTLKIEAAAGNMSVHITYRDVHFPPAELPSRS